MHPDAILAIDIGGGTQDILLWSPDERLENCPKLILPSPTRIVAARIRKATQGKRSVFLHGNVMGGGSSTSALKAHLSAGLKAYATRDAALTFHDNIEYVRGMGVELREDRPRGAETIRLGDLDLDPLRRLLEPYETPLPERLAAAVQDHGFSPIESNRQARFAQWTRFLAAGGFLRDLMYETPPPQNTRMAAVQAAVPGALVMDTGSAAITGALLDEWAASRKAEGVLVVNAGNEHTLAALVIEDRVYGVYEHHTSCLDLRKVTDHLTRFRQGSLTFEQVFQDQGHGVAYAGDVGVLFQGAPAVVTGPQRHLLGGTGMRMAAPFGDMMLSGCFGLVQNALARWNLAHSLSPAGSLCQQSLFA